MRPIQYLLIFMLFIGVICYLRVLRCKLFDRMLALVLFALGTALIALPESATDLANLLGVGRGTDLITYLAYLTFGYMWLILYTKIRFLERKNTELVRALAIDSALVQEQSNVTVELERIRKAG